jgi:putative tryptophan/tyrosine transport system substrate-binding protein
MRSSHRSGGEPDANPGAHRSDAASPRGICRTPAIPASGDHSVVASRQASRTVPIVFTTVADPVGTGYVESLARPGGNMTGFTLFEYSTSAKWMELLKEIAPGVKRAGVIRESGTATGTGFFAAIQAAAQAPGVELSPIGVGDAGEIEGGIAAFARSPNGGLIDCSK